jgi:hypothetical protein
MSYMQIQRNYSDRVIEWYSQNKEKVNKRWPMAWSLQTEETIATEINGTQTPKDVYPDNDDQLMHNILFVSRY